MLSIQICDVKIGVYKWVSYKKMKAKLEDSNGFLKENKSKIGGFPPTPGRMKIRTIEPHVQIY